MKKDPGIPNLFPYKERLLQEIEEKKARKAVEAQRRKEAVKAARTGQVNQAGDAEGAMEDVDGEEFEGDDDMMDDDDVDESNPMAALIASARRAAETYERDLESGDEMDEDDDESDSDDDDAGLAVAGNATSRRAYDKVFKQVVEQADVVLYVLDARDPEGTRSRDVERSVMAAAESGKRLILVLNKIDLVPAPVLRAWLAHLRREFPTLPIRASNAAPNAHTFNHKDLTVQSTSATLFRALKAFAAGRNLKRSISVGVIGYPNVGKSSVINSLLARLSGSRQRSACPAGAEAGVTTSIRAVKIDSKLTLLDSPGIVFPTTTDVSPAAFVPKNASEAHAHLVLLNAVPPRLIEDPKPAVTLLLKRLSTSPALMEKLTSVYDLPALMSSSDTGDATMDFLVQVARRRGRLGRGGVPNIQAAAMTVVTDWRDGRIQGWVDAPADAAVPAAAAAAGEPSVAGIKTAAATPAASTAADQKQIVTEWAAEFKLEGLWGDDEPAATKEVDMQG